MAELEKIVFKDLPDETTPVSAENLNKFQDNIETVISEETTAMNKNADKKLEEVKTDADTRVKQLETNADTKLQEFDTTSKQKLTDIQQQVDTAIEEMKGLVGTDKIEELQQKIETNATSIESLENNQILYGTCTEEEFQAAMAGTS